MAGSKRAGNKAVNVVSTLISIFLVLLMIGFLELFLVNAQKVKRYLKENIELQIMFRDSAKDADVVKWFNTLQAKAYTRYAKVVSKEDAKKQLAEDWGEGVEDLLGFNPLPVSINLKVHEAWANNDSLQQIEAYVEADPLIREMAYKKEVVKKIDGNIEFISWLLLAIALVFLIISITLINSTVRLTLYSKRFLVKSMQLVGATRSFIRKPFMWQSILTGLSAALLACLVLLGFLVLLQELLPQLIIVDDSFMIVTVFGSVLILGFIITAVSSYFAINKYLNLKIEDLY